MRTLIKAGLSLSILVVCLIVRSHQMDRFCPLEKKGDECRAKRNQFKCGAFFVNLSGQTERLRWLGALPDFLYKSSAHSSPKLKASFHNMKKQNFRVKEGECTDSMANEKCFDLMEDIARTRLDSCAPNILNEKGDRTLGDILCQRAMFYVPAQHFHSFEKVGFYHSACAGNWTQTLDSKERPLLLKEELCCKYENDKGWFFRCDGSEFQKECA
eukprot:maker-scaffold244_size240795-snap-gene-1.33 protein:Tk02095 transcript:maker-scaffold244_size240795-snap-gene-1.33-mRNA-1 annotation:"---NA---"